MLPFSYISIIFWLICSIAAVIYIYRNKLLVSEDHVWGDIEFSFFQVIAVICLTVLYAIALNLALQFCFQISFFTEVPIRKVSFHQFLFACGWIFIQWGLSYFPRGVELNKIWGGGVYALMSAFFHDFQVAFKSWLLSLPLLLFFTQFTSTVLYFAGFPFNHEQAAVVYFRSAMDDRIASILLFVSVALLVPIAEEWFFRGIIHRYLRKFLNKVPALMLSSLFFTALHYETRLGWSNLGILLPLLVLAFFLGMLYEKYKRLTVNVFFHILVNTATSIMILMSPR
ncbi:MAG: putative rane protein [Chlamydiales bacterium]|nr:putative rane protein [Chlamydiales bacterium]